MVNNNQKPVEYVPKRKGVTTLIATAGFTAVFAILIVGNATYTDRIDTAKEKALQGKKLNYTEVQQQQAKIRKAKYAIAYYCEDNPNDENCTTNNQNDDRRNNPLGNMQQVSYTPKNSQYVAMPPNMLGQSVPLIATPKQYKAKIKPKKDTFSWQKAPPTATIKQSKKSIDKINQIIAENTMGIK